MNQPLVETNGTAPGAASTRDILVDIRTAGEYINISACGAADANILAYVIERPSGAIEPTFTTAAGVATTGRIACNNTMTGALTTPYRYLANEVGTYKIRLINVTAANFNRFDITVTPNNVANPDPTGNTGIRGRVSSLVWTYATGSFAATSATNANYYTLTPGGFPGTNYVWQLDLNQLAGNGYSITSNNLGVNAPRSGFSTPIAGNSSTPLYRVYLNYPEIAAPPPGAAASVTGFRFVDNAGQDFGISPGGTAGVQDSGNFEFSTNAIGATYAISIDVNKNGIFGDAGDVVLTGNAATGFNSVPWNGTNNSGTPLPLDTYQARGEVRLGEFHFIGNDIETSGGTGNGLTIFLALSQTSLVPTDVYWDDVTVLGAAAGGTANTPGGAVSGTAAGFHTWGNFTGTGFGDARFIDTYVYGERTQASLFVAIVNDDNPLLGVDGVVTITPTSTPGDTLTITLTDADLNSLTAVVETIVVQVVNPRTGQSEAVTLTETGANTGIFTGTLATAAGAASNGNNSGTMNTQGGDTVRVSYFDALTSTGGNTTRTADDVVSAAAVVVTPTNDAGSAASGTASTAVADVTDNDLVNGAAVVLGTGGNAVISQVSTSNPGVTLDPATGAVNVAANVPPGSYTLTYQLCDLGSPATCVNADVTITVTATAANVAPVADSGNATSGTASAPVADVTDNDLVNGAPAVLGAGGNATISQIASGNPGITLDPATGAVNVAANVPPGSYTLTYQLCDLSTPVNCTNQDVTITVAANIAPATESGSVSAGVGGSAIANVAANDSVNGALATLGAGGNAVLSFVSSTNAGIRLDPATGEVNVAASVPVGSYTLRYQICDRNTPANCATQDDTITVSANVTASNDSGSAVSGFASIAVNVLGNDQVNGSAPTLGAGGTATLIQTASSNPGIQLDPATGDVTVAANVPAGTYTLDYQLCDRATPANCAPAQVTVTVALPTLSAADDSVADVIGAAGAVNVLNLFNGDTINAIAATVTNTTLAVASGSFVPAQLSFDPTTGNVSVNPGTPAGTYSFNYEICDPLNAGNCRTAQASVTVAATAIATSPDSATGVDGAVGAANVVNAFAGDQIGGLSADPSNAILSVATGSSLPAVLTFDIATGNVSVVPGTPAGTYSFQYQICERAVPSNCMTETISVTVASATLVATNDSVSGVNGASGAPNIVNAFTGDTINGAAATPANAILSVATGFTVPAGLTFDPATGNVSVDPGTPAGSYSFDYQMCERLNPDTCTTARITVVVAASAVVATPDTVNGVNGATGDPDVGNVLSGDTVNGAAATPANSILSLAPGAMLPAALTFDPATGVVGVVPGTPAGSYSFDYQICERLNPTRCETARFTANVADATIVAAPDSATGVNGATGNSSVLNVLGGDSLNGAPAIPANIILSVATGSTLPAGLAFDPATGVVGVVPGTPAGVYTFQYQICERLNPANCEIATVSITVDASDLTAVADSVTGVNGAIGAANVLNVLTGDLVNGATATSTNATLRVATGSSVPAGLTFDPATGNVSVAAGTPAGTYAFVYEICEALNPTNCKTANASVTTAASAITTAPDTANAVNGATGNPAVLNVLGGDSINGEPATPANSILSVAPGSTVPAGLSFDPTTGIVGVAPGTPAGPYNFSYQICERLNPNNCRTETVTINVASSSLTPPAATPPPVNGATGNPSVANGFSGGTINGQPATPGGTFLQLVPGTTVPNGLTFNLSTGSVGVVPGTPAGTYTIPYQLCETLNPSNCVPASITVTVTAAPLVAVNDSATGVNGANGAADVLNLFNSDSINGAAATPANSNVSVASGSSVPSALTFDATTGAVGVRPGTPAGTYNFTYRLCEQLNPANCQTAEAIVTVAASGLALEPQTPPAVNGATGNPSVANVLTNAAINGNPITPGGTFLQLLPGTTVPNGLTFDLATGTVGVAPGTPAGTYTIQYQLCETLNPTNCVTSSVTVTVVAAALVATPDQVSGINGATGNADALNIFGGDTLNGAPATPANSIVRVAPGTTLASALTFDPATGVVGVRPGTPAGTYTLDYQICERLNPDNCRTARATVVVAPSGLAAPGVIVDGINGSTGNPNVGNAFTGAAVNGQPATPNNSFLQLVPGTTVPQGLTFDLATGTAGVAPGTPAGTYVIRYQLCETLNPSNCVEASVTVTVVNPSPVGTPDTTSVVTGNPVTISVLGNDRDPDGDPLTIRSTTPPAHGQVTVNQDGTITYVPSTGYTGTDSFTYTACDPSGQCTTQAVTVTVHPSVSALNGTVYLDLDADGTRDPNEPLQPNWVVEVVRDGQVVATVRTDSNGFYEVPNLPLGSGYSVVFRHPTTNVVYGMTNGIALNAGVTTVDLDRPIDPSGVVYDSIARTPIAGARLTLVDAAGNPLPVSCFVDPSQQNQLTGTDGRYRFDIVPGRAAQCPATETGYRIAVAGPADTLPGASTIILPEIGALDPTGLGSPVAVVTSANAPQAGEATRYFYDFRLASGDGDVINNHIPLDRSSALAPLGVTKTSTKRTASVGDLVPYTIVIRNTQAVARNNVDVVDTMPAGFRFVEGSARLGNAALAPVVSGRELGWRNLSVPANGSLTFSLVLTAGSSVTDGDAVNLADARDARSGRPLSNQGQATVRITPSALFDCSEIIGKVFEDLNGNGYQDKGEPGVAAARVVTANGLLITADQYGRYHVTCAAVPNANIGSNFILKLDPRSVPTGTRITTENPRVVRLTRGKISEIDFGVQKLDRVTLELGKTDFNGAGEASSELKAKVTKLAETLVRNPATVVLHYQTDTPEDAAVNQSLKAVAQTLESAWKQAGGKEQLKIERRAGPARPVVGKE